MADEKISELDAAEALTGTEEVPVVQSGATVQTTTQEIADLGGAPDEIIGESIVSGTTTSAGGHVEAQAGYYGGVVFRGGDLRSDPGDVSAGNADGLYLYGGVNRQTGGRVVISGTVDGDTLAYGGGLLDTGGDVQFADIGTAFGQGGTRGLQAGSVDDDATGKSANGAFLNLTGGSWQGGGAPTAGSADLSGGVGSGAGALGGNVTIRGGRATAGTAGTVKVQLATIAQTDVIEVDDTGLGFYGHAPVAQQTGVAVDLAAVHAALVNLGLITA